MMNSIFKIVLIISVAAVFSCTMLKKQVESPSTPKLKMEGNTKINKFRKAKKLLPPLYESHKTFYCGCSFAGKVVSWDSCGYKSKGGKENAKKVEWEHIVPASQFGNQLPSWTHGHPDCTRKNKKTYKGRDCARKVNAKFNLMESDLYNLKPAIGEVNNRRSNYPIGMIAGEKRAFGECDIEIENKTMEPRPEIRGDIARIYLYMDQSYPGFEIVNDSNRKLIQKWEKEDPVSQQECLQAKDIEKVQGNINGVLALKCKTIMNL